MVASGEIEEMTQREMGEDVHHVLKLTKRNSNVVTRFKKGGL